MNNNSQMNDLLAEIQHWADTMLAEGQLQAQQTQLLQNLSPQPSSLFKENQQQPTLLVAFLGGTGVGKSSLLNRLAGQAIAKAGVERPTSLEVTLYHHHDLVLQQLPANLPLDSVNCCQHTHNQQQHIIWLDMPDFDSIAMTNHYQVKQWLPYIDVLIYVVSPERYRDNKTWQLLLAEGRKHAWLFVMNQWDLAQTGQLEDFKQQLQLAGFMQPAIFCCSCYQPYADEFDDLVDYLQNLAQQHNIVQLAAHQQQQQTTQLHAALKQLQVDIAKRNFEQLTAFFQQSWQGSLSAFQQGLAWPLQQQAKQWLATDTKPTEIRFWDDWAQSRLQDILASIIEQADQLGIPIQNLKNSFVSLADNATSEIHQHSELALRIALLNPGNRWQRFFLRLMAICEILLPILTMSAVAYQVFYGYYDSISHKQAYLGADFAIHSSLLIAISWLLPYFLHQKLQPSLEKTALTGLKQGLQQALINLNSKIIGVLQAEQQINKQLISTVNGFIQQSQQLPTVVFKTDNELSRVLLP